MERRSFLAGMLAACAAPAIVRSGILMPIRPAGIDLSAAPSTAGVFLGPEFGSYEGFRFVESKELAWIGSVTNNDSVRINLSKEGSRVFVPNKSGILRVFMDGSATINDQQLGQMPS